MDGAHHYIALCRAQTAGNIQMALFESCFIVKAKHIYENRPVSMDKQAIHTTARVRIGDIEGCAVQQRNKNVKSSDLMQLCMCFHKNHLGHYWEKEDLPILTHPLYT